MTFRDPSLQRPSSKSNVLESNNFLWHQPSLSFFSSLLLKPWSDSNIFRVCPHVWFLSPSRRNLCHIIVFDALWWLVIHKCDVRNDAPNTPVSWLTPLLYPPKAKFRKSNGDTKVKMRDILFITEHGDRDNFFMGCREMWIACYLYTNKHLHVAIEKGEACCLRFNMSIALGKTNKVTNRISSSNILRQCKRDLLPLWNTGYDFSCWDRFTNYSTYMNGVTRTMYSLIFLTPHPGSNTYCTILHWQITTTRLNYMYVSLRT